MRLEDLRQDLHFGARQLLANPGFTLPCVLALALGIGGTTAIFSVMYAVLLHPLPFQEPERLVTMWESDLRRGQKEVEISYQNFREWQKKAHSFEGIAAISSVNLDFALTGNGVPQQVEGTIVSGSFSPYLARLRHSAATSAPPTTAPGLLRWSSSATGCGRRASAPIRPLWIRTCVSTGNPGGLLEWLPPSSIFLKASMCGRRCS
jgi:hypothetical protein